MERWEKMEAPPDPADVARGGFDGLVANRDFFRDRYREYRRVAELAARLVMSCQKPTEEQHEFLAAFVNSGGLVQGAIPEWRDGLPEDKRTKCTCCAECEHQCLMDV